MRYWKKMREEGAKHPSVAREDDNPWGEQERARLGHLSSTYTTVDSDAAQSARYTDWAERIKEKRNRLAKDQAGEPSPSYWSTDALFEESRRVEDDEILSRPNPWRVMELLATLDLREGASTTEIGEAYRRLAKKHHPDRFVNAEPAIQEFHAEKMRDVITAYRTLKELQKT
jgi:DnaJ-domain-containing protein 1